MLKSLTATLILTFLICSVAITATNIIGLTNVEWAFVLIPWASIAILSLISTLIKISNGKN